jgi:hypothetical protein
MLKFSMNFLCAYFGSFPCLIAYIFKGLLGHKSPVPNNYICTYVQVRMREGRQGRITILKPLFHIQGRWKRVHPSWSQEQFI